MSGPGARGVLSRAAILLAAAGPAAADNHAAVWHGVLEPPAEGSCELVLAPTGDAFAARSDLWAGDVGLDPAGDGSWTGTPAAGGEVLLAMPSGAPEGIRVRDGTGGPGKTCRITRFGRPLGRDLAAPQTPRKTEMAAPDDAPREAAPSPTGTPPAPDPVAESPPTNDPPAAAAPPPPLPEPDPDSALSLRILEAAEAATDPEVRARLVDWHERYLGRR